MFLLAVFTMAGAARAQTSAGTVSSVSGQVQIQRGGATLAATPNTSVDQGDKITSGSDGHAVITLTDQSKLTLEPSTAITIEQYTGGGTAPTRVGLDDGTLRSIVNGSGDAPADYQVLTPNAIVTVNGTDFYTGYKKKSPQFGKLPDVDHFTEVDVVHGIVKLAAREKPDKCVDVGAGTGATVAGHKPPKCHGRKFDRDRCPKACDDALDRYLDRDRSREKVCEQKCRDDPRCAEKCDRDFQRLSASDHNADKVCRKDCDRDRDRDKGKGKGKGPDCDRRCDDEL